MTTPEMGAIQIKTCFLGVLLPVLLLLRADMFYGLPFIHSDRDPAFQKRQQSSRSDPIVFLKTILPDVTLKHRQMLRPAQVALRALGPQGGNHALL